MLKVTVDFDLCESNGLCEALAPAVFRLDDDDFLQVLTEEAGPDQADAVRRAVASCPRAAISVVEG